MNICLRVIVIVTALASLTVGAQEPEPWRKSVGELHTVMFLTDDGDAFFKKVTTSEGELVLPPSTEAARLGARLATGIFFKGCLPNTKGRCDLSVEFTVFSPDGTLYKNIGISNDWRDKPAPSPTRMPIVGVVVDQIDSDAPSGRYTVRATVRDHNAVVDLELERTIELEQRTGKK